MIANAIILTSAVFAILSVYLSPSNRDHQFLSRFEVMSLSDSDSSDLTIYTAYLCRVVLGE